MNTNAVRGHAAPRGWLLLLSIGIPLVALLASGMDNNWDLYNYHLYGPHAWLQDRFAIDIAAAQQQSFHNPLLDVPLYLLVSAGLPAVVVGAWLALPFMIALYCLLRLYVQLGPSDAGRIDTLALALLACSGVSASMALGSSFNDAFVAAGVLGGMLILCTGASPAIGDRRWCLAGLVLGAVAGLKLTAVLFCVGMAAMALVAGPMRSAPRRLAALLLGGLLGAALTYGHWGWDLYQQYGNPVFPYANQVFQSPDALPVAHGDERFRAQTLADLALIPVRLLQESTRYSEWQMRDPRLLAGLLALALLWPGRQRRPEAGIDGWWWPMTAFFLVSLALWGWKFGIYRYLLPLEMLSGLLVVLLVARHAGKHRGWALVVVLALAFYATQTPEMGRKDFDQPVARVDMPVLPADSLVVISGGSPVGFAVARLPDTVPAIAVHNNFLHPQRCTALQARAGERLLQHRGSLWLLRDMGMGDNAGERLLAQHYGLVASRNCYPVAADAGRIKLCQLHRRELKAACQSLSRPD